MSKAKSISIFGSTGSVGTQTLDVLQGQTEFEVLTLTANENVDLLIKQAKHVKPRYVSLASRSDSKRRQLAEGLSGQDVEIVPDSRVSELAAESDISLNAIVGFAGLNVTVGTLAAGKRLALANKESMIAAGPLVQKVRSTSGAEILPVDSEHAAIHQCLAGRSAKKIQLTASGGPFRKRDDLDSVTIEDALNHPTWNMGRKITIDSSTLMNKGLEVIEANELFCEPAGTELTLDDVQVVVHPQSIVHSMVTFSDGSTIAHLSEPDMKLPIAYALYYPDRAQSEFGVIDWSKPMTLEFEQPDVARFKCLGLAYEAASTGGAAPAWINAANEVAVAAFLEGKIKWIQIAQVISDALSQYNGGNADELEEVIDEDRAAREVAQSLISSLESV